MEKRFNLPTRLLGASLYILFQVGRLAIVLLLPSLALTVVTGFPVEYCILLMGLLSIGYTVLGGIEAVIWTDVLQTIVLLGGAIMVLVLIPFQLESSWGEIGEVLSQYEKVKLWDLSLDMTGPTLWVILLGGFMGNIFQYGTDQTVVQRYLTTKNEHQAARSIRLGAWMSLPATLIFIPLGTMLFLFFRENPTSLPLSLDNTDAIFPWYIYTQLPSGVSGILIAAIFAAAMSSLDSSMHSVSTVLTTDFYKRLFPPKSDRRYMRIAQGITCLTGLIGISLALYMARSGISSLWDQYNLIIGLFVGGLGGIFVLGIFSQKAHGLGALIALVLSAWIQYLISQFTPIHFLLYTATGFASSFVLGYLISWLFPAADPSNTRLTYKTLQARKK